MRYLKKNEMDMDTLPSYNFKGFIYAPTTHAGRVYHTVYKNYRYVTDLYGPSNGVFSKKEFIDAIQKGFQRYAPRKS
jgi:hypothetical protein